LTGGYSAVTRLSVIVGTVAGLMHVLVTGGAGYIGSHACKALARAGYVPVTVDNLVTGWRAAVRYGPFVEADMADRAALDAVFQHYRPVAVLHFAALSQVGESMVQPGRYWRNNVLGSLNVIEAALAAGCKDIVFSSTCAVYGQQDGVVLSEDSALAPLNAYGASKRAVEDMLRDFGQSDGLRSVIFRYFNVAGADPDAEIGEWHRPETHLVPIILETLDGQRPELVVHGSDYPTHDGTCVRDYVHVTDVARAHILGLDWLRQGRGSEVFNLGTGSGFSVREVLDHCCAATGKRLKYTIGPRRPGDAATLVSGSQRAIRELGWEPDRSSLKLMIADAWAWYLKGGY
jgi:UDP-glucose 4-epimerase